jgi:molybdenum cofactor cytidylyltransferase
MIAAIVLAAGLSKRMGRFKLLLPWGERTVIGQVVAALESARFSQIVVVTGHRAGEVEAALAGTAARMAFNPDYASGEMLSSIQAGLRAVGECVEAALLCLGDQPQIETATVQAVLAAGQESEWERIVIPSYRMRGGHPILLPAWLWPEIIACAGTLRDVMAAHRDQTHYVAVDTPTVLADLDTPEEYANAARGF